MDDKKKKGRVDAFADMDLGSLDKYAARNRDAVRAERIAETDRRIAAFAAREKTIAWAHEALDFCEREAKFGADIAADSVGVQDLPRIKAEAEAVLAEQARQAEAAAQKVREAEAEAARRAEEARLAEEQRIRDEIRETDELILALSTAPRTYYWCNEVDAADEKVRNLPTSSKLKLRNLPKLDAMRHEAAVVRLAAGIDEDIVKLRRGPQNLTWAREVIATRSRITDENRRYLKEAETLEKLCPAANKIVRGPRISEVEKMLAEMEREWNRVEGLPEDVYASLCESYAKAESLIGGLDYDMGEYIQNFGSRWAAVCTKVRQEKSRRAAEKKEAARRAEEEKRRLKEEEAARRKREAEEKKRAEAEAAARKKREEEERKRLALQRAREQAARERRNRIIIAVAIVVYLVGMVLGTALLSNLRVWVLGIGVPAGMLAGSILLRLKDEDLATWWQFGIGLAVSATALLLLCISDETRPLAIGFAAGEFASSVALLIFAYQRDTETAEYNCASVGFLLGGLLLAIAVGTTFFTGTIAAVVVAVGLFAVYAGKAIVLASTHDYEYNDVVWGILFGMDIAAALCAIIFAFVSVPLAIVGIGLAAAAILNSVLGLCNDRGFASIWTLIANGVAVLLGAIMLIVELVDFSVPSINMGGTTAWVIAVIAAVMYVLLSAILQAKDEDTATTVHMIVSIVGACACLPLFFLSETTMIVAFGIAGGILLSAVYLLFHAYDGYDTENYNYQEATIFVIIGGALASIALAFTAFTGAAIGLCIGIGVFVTYTLATSMVAISNDYDCNDALAMLFFFIDLAMVITSAVFAFLGGGFALAAIGMSLAALIDGIIGCCNDREETAGWIALFSLIVLITAVITFFAMHGGFSSFDTGADVLPPATEDVPPSVQDKPSYDYDNDYDYDYDYDDDVDDGERSVTGNIFSWILAVALALGAPFLFVFLREAMDEGATWLHLVLCIVGAIVAIAYLTNESVYKQVGIGTAVAMFLSSLYMLAMAIDDGDTETAEFYISAIFVLVGGFLSFLSIGTYFFASTGTAVCVALGILVPYAITVISFAASGDMFYNDGFSFLLRFLDVAMLILAFIFFFQDANYAFISLALSTCVLLHGALGCVDGDPEVDGWFLAGGILLTLIGLIVFFASYDGFDGMRAISKAEEYGYRDSYAMVSDAEVETISIVVDAASAVVTEL